MDLSSCNMDLRISELSFTRTYYPTGSEDMPGISRQCDHDGSCLFLLRLQAFITDSQIIYHGKNKLLIEALEIWQLI